MGLIELVISSANMKLFIILKLAWDGMNWVTGKSQMLTCWHQPMVVNNTWNYPKPCQGAQSLELS